MVKVFGTYGEKELDPLLLALEILRRIPRNQKISAPELHKSLAQAGIKRDLRTIQRHLEHLSDQFGIERDERQKPYGYRWGSHTQGLSMPSLSEQESLLLLLAEQHLNHLLPASIMQSLNGFFEQAKYNLNPRLDAPHKTQREREWLGKIRVVSETQPLIPPPIDQGVFTAVSNALYANHWLNITYRNAADKITESAVMPLGLAQQGPRLYLVCRFDGYDDDRNLALHRIQSARESTLSFERPKDFNLAQYDADGRFGFGDGQRVRLSFNITKDAGKHLIESPLSTDQHLIEHEDGYAITATVVETARLEWWLRGFGDEVWAIEQEAIEK